MDPILLFRELAQEDYPIMLGWLQQPHVHEWWKDAEDTLEAVRAEFSGALDEAGEIVRRFLLIDSSTGAEQPVGYFQYYILSDGAIGTDQFIGEPTMLDRGVGTEALRLFLAIVTREVVAQFPEMGQPLRVVVDPDATNSRAIRCYEKVGFRHVGNEWEGKPAYLMEIWI